MNRKKKELKLIELTATVKLLKQLEDFRESLDMRAYSSSEISHGIYRLNSSLKNLETALRKHGVDLIDHS